MLSPDQESFRSMAYCPSSGAHAKAITYRINKSTVIINIITTVLLLLLLIIIMIITLVIVAFLLLIINGSYNYLMTCVLN